jgi:FkbM family methyltransferase
MLGLGLKNRLMSYLLGGKRLRPLDWFGVKFYFGQCGEDAVLQYFIEQPTGFYVDVGANDPIVHSNTNVFFLRGWRGLNIDPNPKCIERFQQQRPADINVRALLSDTEEELEFYHYWVDKLNTCSLDIVAERKLLNDPRFVPISSETIRTVTLTSIFEKHLSPTQQIDLMTIDCEGMDLRVLRSNDWHKWFPVWLVVEDKGNNDSDVCAFLLNLGYTLIGVVGVSKIFKKKAA